jgi:transposase InsO family protein
MGGGQTGAAMRGQDWANSSLGRPAEWPQPLKTMVGVLLAADQPMFIGWGPDHILLYNDIKYTERLAEAGIEPSVGSVGDSYDNALAETINGLYKAEVIHRRGPWRSFEAVEYATLEWVDWFNHRRLLEPIGNIPPAEAEDQYYAAADNIDMAA